MKKTKILITGAGGFLGSHIVKKLILNESYEVYGFSRSFYPWLEALGVRQRLGDLRKSEDVEKALSGMDAVIHTASLVGMWGKYEDFYATNVIGTENILHALKKHNIKKLIYTSTPSVVFVNLSLCGVDETTPFPSKYLSHYASTKALAEKSVLQANGPELYTVALRPHLIFGPGDTNLIPRVIQAQKEKRLKIIGDAENLVDVTYVENAADAHIMALEKLTAIHPIAGKAYFIGQGPIKLWDFTNDILSRAGLPPVVKKMPLPIAYCLGFFIEYTLRFFNLYKTEPPMTRFIALQLGMSHYFNHHNLEADLGFTPLISIEEGLNRLFSKHEIF